MTIEKVLFIASYRTKGIGGHKLSTLTIAKYLKKKGFNVGYLISPPEIHYPDINNSDLNLHSAKLTGTFFDKIIRPLQILRVVRKYHYSQIIACDLPAAHHAFLAVLLYKLPIVQIIAGGPLSDKQVLKIPGIIVFSKELFDGLPSLLNLPQQYFFLSESRIDFNYFNNYTDKQNIQLPFNKNEYRILTISRLPWEKFPSIKAIFLQLRNINLNKQVGLIVIGEGESKKELEKIANTTSNDSVKISFMGGFRVTPDILRQADLVIGQGRTVLEALSAGVPAAVSGNDGYFGLIKNNNFLQLASTNMTGRSLKPFSNLENDLEILGEFKDKEMSLVTELVYNHFDASNCVDIFLSAMESSKKFVNTISRVKILILYLIIMIQKIRRVGYAQQYGGYSESKKSASHFEDVG